MKIKQGMNDSARLNVYCFGGYTLDMCRRQLLLSEECIYLTPEELHTLQLPVDAIGHAVPSGIVTSAGQVGAVFAQE
jgi:hypothetical protein